MGAKVVVKFPNGSGYTMQTNEVFSATHHYDTTVQNAYAMGVPLTVESNLDVTATNEWGEKSTIKLTNS